jgi:hypothetical protein
MLIESTLRSTPSDGAQHATPHSSGPVLVLCNCLVLWVLGSLLTYGRDNAAMTRRIVFFVAAATRDSVS